MRSLQPIFVLAGVVVFALAGCGMTVPQQTHGTAIPATVAPVAQTTAQPAWLTELFFVRLQKAYGPALAYDMATGVQRFTLPAGMPSADWQHYFATSKQAGTTTLDAFTPVSGARDRSITLPGNWALSSVSPNGRWLALTRVASENEKSAWTAAGRWETEVEVVDAERSAVVHTLTLEGNFDIDTISADGTSLFLVQHLPAVNPDHYVIRLYDLSQEQLVADPLRSKSPDEIMAGLAWEGLASPDGNWLLTLYLSTHHHTAFIHALDLLNKFPMCIDLPSGNGNFEVLKQYTLALAPSGQTLYAANASLGVVAEIDLQNRQVTRTTEFPSGAFDKTAGFRVAQATNSFSVITRDGKTLFFTSGSTVWAYDTLAARVSGPYASQGLVTGLGVSSDGQRLYLARVDQPLLVLDAASGKALAFGQAGSS